MHIPVTDKSKFWDLSPAASEIFRYVEENPVISESPWGFDVGNVSDDNNSSYASFSCVAISGWGKDRLTVSASKQSNGAWLLSHRVERAT